MTTTSSLVSHTETVLGGNTKRVRAIRQTLIELERAKNRKQAIAALTDCVVGCLDNPKNGPGRIKLAASASGSVLAGLGITGDWGGIAHEVCKTIDSQQIDWLEETVSGELVDGAEHPWKRDDKSRDKGRHIKNATELPNHSGSYHSPVLRALDQAKAGDQEALFTSEVLNHMAASKPYELAADETIQTIKAQMAAAELPLAKWEAAIKKRRLEMASDGIGDLYPDKLANGRTPDPKSLRNVQAFLEATDAIAWFDEFNQKAFIDHEGKTALLDDDSLREWMFHMRERGLRIDKDPASDALTTLAKRNKRHPVREYLASLKWDGKPRVDVWLSRYAGAKDTELNRVYGRKFLIGAVRRITKPGTKLRAMPILEGEQNIGKSLVFKTLAVNPEWYTDSLELGCDPKEVIELTEGKWIVETPELSGMTNRDVEHVKAMVSRDVDKARLAYSRFPTEVPRQFVLGGTTNTEEYLKDRTGNTRFWGIKVARPKIKALEKDRDQLWAEAVHIEESGEPHWLDTPELQELARKSAQKREEQNPLEQVWISTFEQAKKLGNVFLSSDDLYRAVGLEDIAKLHQGHKNSLRYAAKRAGWASERKRIGEERSWGYVPCGIKAGDATPATYDRMSKRFKAAKPRGSGAGL